MSELNYDEMRALAEGYVGKEAALEAIGSVADVLEQVALGGFVRAMQQARAQELADGIIEMIAERKGMVDATAAALEAEHEALTAKLEEALKAKATTRAVLRGRKRPDEEPELLEVKMTKDELLNHVSRGEGPKSFTVWFDKTIEGDGTYRSGWPTLKPWMTENRSELDRRFKTDGAFNSLNGQLGRMYMPPVAAGEDSTAVWIDDGDRLRLEVGSTRAFMEAAFNETLGNFGVKSGQALLTVASMQEATRAAADE